MRVVIFRKSFAENNDYIMDRMILPLFTYMSNNGYDVSWADEDIAKIKNSKVLVHAVELPLETMKKLKENGNVIFSFDINDHSWFTYTYQVEEEAPLYIDYIFKCAGVQLRDSYNVDIGNDLTITKKKREFAPKKVADIYKAFADSNRIFPLPHLHFLRYNRKEPKLYEQRERKVLIRGGHHFLRVILYLRLMTVGHLSSHSGFAIKSYISQWCENCKSKFKSGGVFYNNYKDIKCDNPLPHLNEKSILPDNYFNVTAGQWNNRCTPMYFKFIELYKEMYGGLDFNVIDNSFNSDMIDVNAFYSLLDSTMFASDYKWIYSIYVPPRFWEAASARTINLLPKATNDQRHFPDIKDGEHYLTFNEDMTGFDVIDNITKEQYNYITKNCHDVFLKYIEPNDQNYPQCNTNLLQHMADILVNNNGIN